MKHILVPFNGRQSTWHAVHPHNPLLKSHSLLLKSTLSFTRCSDVYERLNTVMLHSTLIKPDSDASFLNQSNISVYDTSSPGSSACMQVFKSIYQDLNRFGLYESQCTLCKSSLQAFISCVMALQSVHKHHILQTSKNNTNQTSCFHRQHTKQGKFLFFQFLYKLVTHQK